MLAQLQPLRRALFSRAATTAAAAASTGAADAGAAAGSTPLTEPERKLITIARGDGIGPEIMEGVLRVLEHGAAVDFEEIEIGEKVYGRGVTSGIEPSGWESLDKTRVFLKAPITTPLGGGVKSLNVTVRKTLGLYANIRPVVSLDPFVKAMHPRIDVVVIRENEEDLYSGVEHRHTSEVMQCLKLITVPGTERICRHAFEYARAHGRRKITCMTKNNIMKLTDGTFARIFDQIALEYPDIETEHMIIDIGAARLASRPHSFDTIVSLNLYGDIISDIASEVSGSVGLAGSANIGDSHAMFEAVHGSAPDLAGRNVANPSGLLNAATMMLSHIGQRSAAQTIRNALLCTLEDGIHTVDIYQDPLVHAKTRSRMRVGTHDFCSAVIDRLGKVPTHLPPAVLNKHEVQTPNVKQVPQQPVLSEVTKEFFGIDIFLDYEDGRNPDELAQRLQAQAGPFELQMISNRGVKVWPAGNPATYKVDHWRCRFVAQDESGYNNIPALIQRLQTSNLEVIKTENLYLFDGEPGFSLSQGQ